jgi:tyrosyl-tRNA synthetase
MLSDVDIALITGAAAGGSSESELLKEALAYSMTAAIRGDAAALVAENASRGRGRVAVGLPTADATPDEAADLPGLMVKAGLAPSKGAARRLAANGGLRVNGEQRLDPVLTEAEIDGETLVLSAGKTLHRAIRVAPAPHPMPSRR